MRLGVVLVAPFVCAVVTALLPAKARTRAAAIAGVTTLALLVYLASFFPAVRDGGHLVERIAWVPGLGLDLAFRLPPGASVALIVREGLIEPMDRIGRAYRIVDAARLTAPKD